MSNSISAIEPPEFGYWPTVNALYHERYRQSGLVVLAVNGCGAVDKSRLAGSVSAIQQYYPPLRCTVSDTGDRYALKAAQDAAQVELECKALDSEQSIYDISEKLATEDLGARLWRIVLVTNAEHVDRWSLLVFCHHSICDVQSLLLLAEDILLHYVSDETGLEPRSISAPSGMVPESLSVDMPAEQSQVLADQETAGAAVSVQAELSKRVFRWKSLPTQDLDLDALLAACRREKVTLTNLLVAATLRAVATSGNSKVTTAISFRNRVEPTVPEDAFGCYIGMLESVVPHAESIWDHARNCAAVQFQNINRVLLPRLTKPLIEMMMSRRIEGVLRNGEFAGGCAVSNGGVSTIPAKFGSLTIDSVDYTTLQLAGLYSMFLSVISHAGKLHMSISYAEPLLSEDDIKGVIDSVVAELVAVSR